MTPLQELAAYSVASAIACVILGSFLSAIGFDGPAESFHRCTIVFCLTAVYLNRKVY